MFRSQEEIYFSWWLDELKEVGIIDSYIYEPTTFTLCPKVEIEYSVVTELKTKTKVETKKKVLLNDLQYTPDFLVKFNKVPSFFNRNFFVVDNLWWVDCKGTFAGVHNNSAVTFPLNQKFLYDKERILVEKVVPQKLFAHTFTPKRFLMTDKEKQQRKIKWKIILIEDVIR